MKKQKILVIGADGFLGKTLMKELLKQHDVIGTYYKEKINDFIELDLNNHLLLEKTLNGVSPEIIVLAAAETNIDLYETNNKISLNQISSANKIVKWCNKNNSLLVFFSTDFVFDGTNNNYKETDATNPISVYGKNKLDIEKIIQKLENHLILRLSFLYGLPLSSDKFVGRTILKLLEGEKVSAVTDWKRNPTLTKDVAFVLISLIEKKQTGLFHVVGSSSVSPFEAALAIAKEFDVSSSLIKKIKGEELNLSAKRPLNSSLSISKLVSKGIQMSPFEQGLKFIHKNMEKKI